MSYCCGVISARHCSCGLRISSDDPSVVMFELALTSILRWLLVNPLDPQTSGCVAQLTDPLRRSNRLTVLAGRMDTRRAKRRRRNSGHDERDEERCKRAR